MEAGRERPILVLNRSYWPDIEATGQFLTELCEKLAERYSLIMLAGRSYFVPDHFKPWTLFQEETRGRVRIMRLRHTLFWKGRFIGRMINWITYSLLALLAALRLNPRLLIVCTDPPFLGMIASVIRCLRGVPFIYNCRDLYPDAAVELGKLPPGLISQAFDICNCRALRGANFIIPLGRSMADRIQAKGIDPRPMRIIPDWADTLLIKPIPREENPLLAKFGLQDRFIIMYSGNLGLSQGFSPILRSLAQLPSSHWQLVFIGDGTGKKVLADEVHSLKLPNVLFLPYQPKDMLSYSLSMADLHLVPLQKGMSGASVPSKVYGIMAAGRPYLAITDPQSEPARIALDDHCGLWAPPDAPDKISAALAWSLAHRNELAEMGQRARRLAETRYDKNVVIQEWLKILQDFFQHHEKPVSVSECPGHERVTPFLPTR